MNDSNPHDVTQDLQGNALPQEDAAPAEHPQRIGRYRIEKVLGNGGFGLVYLAHDEQLNRPVAVKVPHAKLISKPEDAEAYLAEARTVANLDHPGIVPVHDVGSTEDCPCYVVSKYIVGTDLATKLKQHRLKYREAAELVATVAEALHYAHKQGLVHRDVKPGNILIGHDGKPYVVDFGLALREENIGKGPKYAGTPAYMSPEQARGEGHRVDGRSDIFSLGVVFYELLAGRQPFRGDNEAFLLESGVLTHEAVQELRSENKVAVEEAWEKATAEAEIEAREAEEVRDVYARPTAELVPAVEKPVSTKRFVDALADGLRQAMERDPKLVLMGQDIAEYGGVFKVTEGFVRSFGKDRVRNTPLCESAIVGAALGLSICGRASMVEMQFADFVTCGFNQIVNKLAKTHYRWSQPVCVTVRMPTGAGVGAGPFHSQSTEAWFTHVPGLVVVYPSNPFDAKGLLTTSPIGAEPRPVL